MIDEVSSAYRSFQRLLCKLALDRNEGQRMISKRSALDRSRGNSPLRKECEVGAHVGFQAYSHISDKAGRKCRT